MILEEGIEILSFEPNNTVEGARLKTAKDFRVHLGKIVGILQEQERKQKTEDQKEISLT